MSKPKRRPKVDRSKHEDGSADILMRGVPGEIVRDLDDLAEKIKKDDKFGRPMSRSVLCQIAVQRGLEVLKGELGAIWSAEQKARAGAATDSGPTDPPAGSGEQS